MGCAFAIAGGFCGLEGVKPPSAVSKRANGGLF